MFVTEADFGRADTIPKGSQAGLDRARLLDRTPGRPQRLPTLKLRGFFLLPAARRPWRYTYMCKGLFTQAFCYGVPGRAHLLGGVSPLWARQRELLAGRQGCSTGVDSMTVESLRSYLHEHWPHIKEQLLVDRYISESDLASGYCGSTARSMTVAALI